jgi:hypothetical protein
VVVGMAAALRQATGTQPLSGAEHLELRRLTAGLKAPSELPLLGVAVRSGVRNGIADRSGSIGESVIFDRTSTVELLADLPEPDAEDVARALRYGAAGTAAAGNSIRSSSRRGPMCPAGP